MILYQVAQQKLNNLHGEIMAAFVTKVKSHCNQIKIEEEVVYQYISETNKEVIDTVCVLTGLVVVRNNGLPRYIKLKELSTQHLINLMSCVERNKFS